LISNFFQNINYLIIAKYFSAQDLGYFTRAELFKNLPSQNVSNIVTAVGYPVLAKLQGDSVRMKSVFRDMMTKTFFIVIILMVGMAVTANALILTLLGDQWLPSVPLLQMLCVVGIMLPLNTMNINILNVVGRSDLYLKLQTIVQLFVLPNIFIGVFFGIKALILGMIGISVLGYIMYSHESNKILNYPIKEQLRDVFPSLLIAIEMGIPVFFIGYFSSFDSLITLIIQVMTGIIIVVGSGEIFSFKEYIFIKTTIIDKFKINIKE
jgi:teichuronic acid exporter